MEDDQNNSMAETGNHSLPNNKTARSVERTTTQKLPIPILEKNDHTSAKLWWRKFTQNIKMTREIDLSKLTNSKEKLPRNRDQLEEEIKDVFTWAIGQSAITEMTKTVRKGNRIPHHYTVVTHYLHYILFRNGINTIAGQIFST